jgi:hypothetical protein
MSDIEQIKRALDVPRLGDRHFKVVEKLRGGKVRCFAVDFGYLTVSGDYPVNTELLINVGGDNVRAVGKSLGVMEG